LTADGEICATRNLTEKGQERKCGKWRGREENTHDRDRGREMEKTLEIQRVMNIGEGE
jgi:hypothetical protein